MNSDNARKVPADAPTDFIKPRWQKLVMTDMPASTGATMNCARCRTGKFALRLATSGWRIAPVQGLRGPPGAAREIRQPQTVQQNCRWPWPPIATST